MVSCCRAVCRAPSCFLYHSCHSCVVPRPPASPGVLRFLSCPGSPKRDVLLICIFPFLVSFRGWTMLSENCSTCLSVVVATSPPHPVPAAGTWYLVYGKSFSKGAVTPSSWVRRLAMAEQSLDLCLISHCVLRSDPGMSTSRNTLVAFIVF